MFIHGTFLTFDPGPLAPYPTWFVSLSLDGRAYSGLGWRSSFVTVHLGEVPVMVWASRAQVLARRCILIRCIHVSLDAGWGLHAGVLCDAMGQDRV